MARQSVLWRPIDDVVVRPHRSAQAKVPYYPCWQHPHWRLKLALHFWVKWNVLSDLVSTGSFQIENITRSRFESIRCQSCARTQGRPCQCDTVSNDEITLSSNVSVKHHATPKPIEEGTGQGSPFGKMPYHRVTWALLRSVDSRMTDAALSLASSYGYTIST